MKTVTIFLRLYLPPTWRTPEIDTFALRKRRGRKKITRFPPAALSRARPWGIIQYRKSRATPFSGKSTVTTRCLMRDRKKRGIRKSLSRTCVCVCEKRGYVADGLVEFHARAGKAEYWFLKRNAGNRVFFSLEV